MGSKPAEGSERHCKGLACRVIVDRHLDLHPRGKQALGFCELLVRPGAVIAVCDIECRISC